MSAANHNTKLSSIDADYVKELKALKDFANDKLKRNSTISIAVQQLITQLEINVANTAKADEFSVTIIDSENAQNNLSFNGNFSLKILKEQLETNRKKVRRLYNKRLGKAWTDLDDRSLVELGFINGDQVYVDFSTVDNSQTSEVNGLQRLVFHNYYPTESAEAVALAVHCCVLDKGFVPLYEQTNQVPGFAAPMKGKNFSS